MLCRGLQVLTLALCFALAACAGPRIVFVPAPITEPVVDRLNESAVRIRWPSSFSTQSVAIFSGIDPQQIDRSLALAISSKRSVRMTADDAAEIDARRRLYFELDPGDAGEPVIVAERQLPLSCCNNFRDLGGYRTADGRSLRWNRLYRADDLSKLTRDDVDYLSQLKVKLVCDFRSNREQEATPDREIEATEQLNLPIDQQGVEPNEIQRKIRTGGLVALGTHQTMIDAYRAFVTDYPEQWAAMFERLTQPENLPTVVHCTAGKDRTGFASALVLLALDVPVETVFEDYLLTNYYQQNFMRFVLRWVPLYSFFRTDPDDVLPLLLAKREYLQASIDAMIETHGSIDGYLEEALGMAAERRAELATQLLSSRAP
jgi:protein-tyrosine phosphatase